MKKTFRKFACAGLALALSAALFAGCGGSPSSSGSTPSGSSEASSTGNTLSAEQLQTLAAGAEALAPHLVECMSTNDTANGGLGVEENTIRGFVLTLSRYVEEETHPYHGIVTRDSNYLYHFPKAKIARTVYEVFGITGWELEADDAFAYDAEKEEHTSGLEFGIGSLNPYYARDVYSVLLEGNEKVEVYFNLLWPNEGGEYPAVEDAPRYRMVFNIITEDGEAFLRYAGIFMAP